MGDWKEYNWISLKCGNVVLDGAAKLVGFGVLQTTFSTSTNSLPHSYPYVEL
jgi:hypothetical protein